MKKSIILSIILNAFTTVTAFAQKNSPDTVVIPLGTASQIIFTVGDPSDLETLKQYDYQALFDDAIKKLESQDSIREESDSDDEILASREENEEIQTSEDTLSESSDDEDEECVNIRWRSKREKTSGRSWQSTNLDVGINNFLADGQIPSEDDALYAVRPWGSWYVGINSVQRARLSRNFFVEWGVGVSWYNFKFERDNLTITKDADGVVFAEDPRELDFEKSKLRATYINTSLVPVLDFGDHRSKRRIWDGSSAFRFGVGPYVGYRIGSKSKLVYEVDDEREKEKNADSFHLNNLRYGLRLQLGFHSTDLFINYDMNELFSENNGPQLNAVSFGLIL